MSTQKSDMAWRLLLMASAASVGVACGDDAEPREPETKTYEATLASFDSCEALDAYLVDLATDLYVDQYVYGYGYAMPVRGGMEGDDLGAPTDSGAEGPTEFTTTNTQELGVDEPDMVKTDGEHMYVLNGTRLTVIDSWPAAETHELAQVELQGWGQQMFLADDRVVVLTTVSTGSYPDGGGAEPGRPVDIDAPPEEGGEPVPVVPDPLDDGTWFNGTRVTIVDVSDPAAPVVDRMFDIEGYIASARMVDGKVYVVTNSELINIYSAPIAEALAAITLPTLEWDATAEEREAVAEALRPTVRTVMSEFVADGGRDLLIPDVRDEAGRSNLFTCGDLMRPGVRSGFSVLSVVGFDPTEAEPSGVGILASGWQVYGSQSSLYVAQDSRWWYWYTPSDAVARTHIHKFELGDGEPAYAASGEVEGWMLNQFSMSEFEGTLRVATTDQANFGMWAVADGGVPVDSGTGTSTVDPAPAPPETDPADKSITDLRTSPDVQANNVFTLQQNGRTLELVGGIRGIAPTEQIYAVRFLGDRGYVVTFRQTDPLFTVDLSDPAAPSIQGELHIPGYSGYLHPFGEGHLIGIGRDGDETGRVGGVQISVFDVSDPAAPTRTAQLALSSGDGSYSWSEAEYDHHAFTFYASRGLLAIPLTIENWAETDGAYSHFSGIVVFRVTGDSVEEFGRVSHTIMAVDRYCGDRFEGDSEVEVMCDTWSYPWWVNMRRSVFADDYLYAISDFGLTVSELTALDEVLAEVRY